MAGLVLILVLLAACGSSSSAQEGTGATATTTESSGGIASPASASAPKISGNLTIFAAASLTEAFTEMKSDIESANPGTSLTLNFAGSSALRTQILQGAQPDLFASADQKNMDQVAQASDIVGDTRIFAENRLVVLIPKDNPGHIQNLKDLANSGLKIVLAQEQVPVGNYARQALTKLSADPAYGSDFKDKVLANLASNELNVKDVVAKVQLGEADAGIVYKTDASSADPSKVMTIDIPDQFNVVAQYPIAVVKGGPNQDAANAFISYLLSPAGQAVLSKYGFVPAPAS